MMFSSYFSVIISFNMTSMYGSLKMSLAFSPHHCHYIIIIIYFVSIFCKGGLSPVIQEVLNSVEIKVFQE
jgi:hypothetical protein